MNDQRSETLFRPAQYGGAAQVRRYVIQYPSPWAAFEAGDYHYAATEAGEDAVLKGAALVMLGNAEDGLPYLEGREAPLAWYARAVALWDEGDHKEALECLGRCLAGTVGDSELVRRAQQLRGLIGRQVEKRPLRVLMQAPNSRSVSRLSYHYLETMKQTSFEVLSVGGQDGDDLTLEPYEPLERVMARLPKGWKPDLYHCFWVDRYLMPVGIERAPFPLTGLGIDYDLRIQTCYYHARLLDAVIVPGGVDHWEMTSGLGLRAFVFPKIVCVHAERFPTGVPKDIDLFLSGATVSPVQNDKSILVYRLRQLADSVRVAMVHGYIPADKYEQMLARSKITFSFIRRQPLWNVSRVSDTLAAGAVALVQEDSGAELFFSEAEGVVSYTEDNLEAVVQRVVARWEEVYRPAALRGREKVLRLFDRRRSMDQYLKRVAILAASCEPGSGGRRADALASHLRYPPTMGGIVATSKARRGEVYRAALQQTVERCGAVPEAERDASSYNRSARAHVALAHQARRAGSTEMAACFRQALGLYTEGRRKHPDSLVLCLNHGRVWYDYGRQCGDEAARERAYEVFGEVVARKDWRLDPLEDLYGEDYLTEFFPFRAYIDDTMRFVVTKETRWIEHMQRIVQAAAWRHRAALEYERGRYDEARQSLRQCLRHFPDYAAYHTAMRNVLNALLPLADRQRGSRAVLEEMAAHMQAAHRLSPYLEDVLVDLLAISCDLKRPTEVARCLREYERLLKTNIARPDENAPCYRRYVALRSRAVAYLKTASKEALADSIAMGGEA